MQDPSGGTQRLRSGQSHRLILNQFEVGYNVPTIPGYYGSDMTTRWNSSAFDQVMRLVREAGGTVVRIWAFEGMRKEGIIFGNEKKPIDILPEFLDHVAEIMRSAKSHQVKVYWTALSGGWDGDWDNVDHGIWRERHYNILNNVNGATDAFQEKVLKPFADRIEEFKDFVFGLDLMNEFMGSAEFWGGTLGQWWLEATAWIEKVTKFVHEKVHWRLPTTASVRGVVMNTGRIAGDRRFVIPLHPFLNGSDFILDHLCFTSVNFYDLHHYNDIGGIYKVNELKALSRRTGKPIILGEFGQRVKTYDDEIKNRVTANFLTDAREHNFSAAFAWRLNGWDKNEAGNDRSYHNTFYNDGYYGLDGPRPVVEIIKQFPRQLITT